MAIYKKIKQLLGYFWNNVWNDNFLVDFICNIYQKVSGEPLLYRLNCITEQVKCSSLLQSDILPQYKLIISTEGTDSVVLLKDIVISASSANTFGQVVPGKSYKQLTDRDIPSVIQDKVLNPSITLYKGKDYAYVDNKLRFSKSLTQYGFQKTVCTIKNQLKQCFQLWGSGQYYNTVLDRFTGILEVPYYWVYKYPGAIQAAWSIFQNGCSSYNVLRLLSCIGNCPVSCDQGTIQKVQGNTVYLKNKIYKGYKPLVTKGQYVSKGQPLFSATDKADDYPHIYTWKDTLPSVLVPQLPVLTSIGYLTALNKDNQIATSNILPLTGQLFSQYKKLCTVLQADQNVPYAEIPETLNTAAYIFNKVWKFHSVLVITPSINTQDMLVAVKFIQKWLPQGTIFTALKYDQHSPSVLYPDVLTDNKILDYYKQSVNNNYTSTGYTN